MLLSRRPNDVSNHGFTNWTLATVHLWGEQPKGKWLLMVRDKNGRDHTGSVKKAVLILHGTYLIPEHFKKYKLYKDEDLVPHVLDQLEVSRLKPSNSIYNCSSIKLLLITLN
jgi:subtilisin-like proprotein convertase family protein